MQVLIFILQQGIQVTPSSLKMKISDYMIDKNISTVLEPTLS